MLDNMVFFSLVALILIGPPAAALVMAVRSSGRWKKLAALGMFFLMLPMLLALLIQRAVLGSLGLAWRTAVKAPCGACFSIGFWGMMLLAGVLLWRRAGRWKPWAKVLGRCATFAATGFLCTVVSFCVLFICLAWVGIDREVTVKGEPMVAESTWEDWDYYVYRGPLVRGNKRVYANCDLSLADF